MKMVTPIEDLLFSLKNQKKNCFVSKHVDWNEFDKPVSIVRKPVNKAQLQKIIYVLKKHEHNFLLSVVNKHKNVISFLLDPLVNPCPKLSPITNNFSNKQKLSFTVECLPVKSQNRLKTHDDLPDLAEVACLIHFEELACLVSEVFRLDCNFKLLVESQAYGKLFGMPKITIDNFNNRLNTLSKSLIKNKRVNLIDWDRELCKLPNFWQEVKQEKENLIKFIDTNDQEVINELKSIFPTIFMSIKSKDNDTKLYMDTLSMSQALKLHAERAKKITINIMAFNRTRKRLEDRLNLFPNDQRGTLTPAQDKWAFFAIGPWNKLYPHHGVGVLNTKNNQVSIHYWKNLSQISNNMSTKYLYYSTINI